MSSLDWASVGVTLDQDSESLGLDLRQEGIGVIPVLVGSVLGITLGQGLECLSTEGP